jgi:hypothetical protein
MTTFLPYRARVYCSLGELIGGQFADTYLQQAGLIFCRGTIELAGIYRPDIGAPVDFAYTRGGSTAARIPRRLRVLSSFADPFTKRTTVQVGCKLSLLQDNREPEEKVTPLDTNPSLPAGWEEYFAAPITANSVATKCLTKLGITAAAALPLANRFTADFIDLSAGYVEVLGKLLESETYVGWLNEDEELEIRSLIGPDIAEGPVINNTNVFTLSPIGVGSLPGEAVTVSYSPLVLRDTSFTIGVSSTLGAASGWSGGITYGFPVNYSIPYGNNLALTGTYIPVQQTLTQFQGGLMVKSSTFTAKPYVVAAGKYASQAAAVGLSVPTTPVVSRSETINRYNAAAQVVETVQTETNSVVEFAGSLDLTFVYSASDFVSIPDDGEVVTQRTVTRNRYNGNAVRREVQRYQNWASIQNGQQAVNEGRQALPDASAVSAYINALQGPPAYTGTEVTVSDTGAEQPPRLPGPAALTEQAYGSGRAREVETLTEYVFGSSNAERTVNFTLPYSGDDYYGLSGIAWVKISASLQSKTKALNYGRVQNRLRLGNAQGVSLQMPVELLPTKPFDAIYLQADGLTGQYRANGMSWTFDQNGIMGQVDALFWLATGQAGTPGAIWFPMPPGVSSLPTTPTATVNGSPAPANSGSLPGGWDPAAPDLTALFGALPTGVAPVFPSTLDVETGLEPFNETVALDAVTRSVLSVVDVPFSLVPQSDAADMVTRSLFVGAQIVLARVPSSALALAPFAPVVFTLVPVPSIGLVLAALAPAAVKGSAYVPVPVTALTLATVAPTVTGNPADPNFASVSLLLPLNGTNGGTTFTDASSNALTVTGSGNAQTSTAQSQWGGSSLLLDGTTDYLTTASDADLAFGTGAFTIEMWVRPATPVNSFGRLVQCGNFGTGGDWQLVHAFIDDPMTLWFDLESAATRLASSITMPFNTWGHVAITRDGTTFRLFVNGVLGASASATHDLTKQVVTVGASADGSNAWAGNMNDLRVTKGVARYTSDFTPPTAAFPTS